MRKNSAAFFASAFFKTSARGITRTVFSLPPSPISSAFVT